MNSHGKAQLTPLFESTDSAGEERPSATGRSVNGQMLDIPEVLVIAARDGEIVCTDSARGTSQE